MKLLQTLCFISVVIILLSCDKDNDTVTPNPLEMQGVMKFNGNLNDSMGKLGTATVVGSPTYVADRNGIAGNALYLNGSTRVTYPTLAVNGTALTISLWVKQSSSPTLAFLLIAGDPASYAKYSVNQSNDRLGVSISTPFTSGVSSGSLDNSWHHFAATYDGIDIRIYIDGVAGTVTNYPGTMGNSVETLVLGYFASGYWTGSIDDLRIYNKALTAAQIAGL
jgi:hypothetical protein